MLSVREVIADFRGHIVPVAYNTFIGAGFRVMAFIAGFDIQQRGPMFLDAVAHGTGCSGLWAVLAVRKNLAEKVNFFIGRGNVAELGAVRVRRQVVGFFFLVNQAVHKLWLRIQ